MPEGVNDVFGGQVTFRLERGGGGVECKEGRGGVTALKVHLNFFFLSKVLIFPFGMHAFLHLH